MKVGIWIGSPERNKVKYVFDTMFSIFSLSRKIDYEYLDEIDTPSDKDAIVLYGSAEEASRLSELVPNDRALLHIHGDFSKSLNAKSRDLLYVVDITDPNHRIPILSSVSTTKLDGHPLFYYAGTGSRSGAAVVLCPREGGVEIQVGFDVVRMIFTLIACEREYRLEQAGRSIGSMFHRLEEKRDMVEEPIAAEGIELIASLLTDLARRKGLSAPRRPSYPGGREFAVCLTHDVDAVKKTILDRAKHARHYTFRFARYLARRRPGEACQEMWRLVKVIGREANYRQFRRVMAIEDHYGYKSTFNFFVLAKGRELSRLYDPRYDLLRDAELKGDVEQILATGREVGLHGSYYTYRNVDLLSAERAELEGVLRQRVRGGRQHFLRFSIQESARAQQEAGFEYDTTLGFRDINGFRAGMCHPFYLYDFENDRPFSVLEIPLVLMDGVLFDRDFRGYDVAWDMARCILEKVKEHKGLVSIVWHQRVFEERDFPYWGQMYERVLGWITQNNGWAGSCADMAKWWNGRQCRRSTSRG